MKILSRKSIDRTEWSRLVQDSTTGTWFQTPEAYDFFASLPELFKPFVFAVTGKQESNSGLMDEDALRGVCVGYVTEEKSTVKQFFTRRAIIIGGPALADDATGEEVVTLMKTAREELQSQTIYIETRNFNDYSRWKEAFARAGFSYQAHLNFHVDTSSVEVVESNLGKSRKRDIRTTIREGVTIIDRPTEEQVKEYYSILDNLYKIRVKTPLFPLPFFQTLANNPNIRFLLTEKNGKIIGGTVCVAQEGKCLYEWFACGEDGVYPHVFPSCYATYAGIRYAAEHSMPRFDMMGAGRPDEVYGVRDFKAKFGGKEVEHGRFLSITKPLLYEIGILGVKILKKIK